MGLVLAVVGTGIWLGVQHLGYPEFGEIRRVAQRTLDQRQIVINNLAIRRATAELKVARDYPQICRILVAAFSSSPGTLLSAGSTGTWGLTLDLVTSSNRRRGSMSVHRLYHERPLQLDVNLLISDFPLALADALDRVISPSAGIVPHVDEGNGLVEAQAG